MSKYGWCKHCSAEKDCTCPCESEKEAWWITIGWPEEQAEQEMEDNERLAALKREDW